MPKDAVEINGITLVKQLRLISQGLKAHLNFIIRWFHQNREGESTRVNWGKCLTQKIKFFKVIRVFKVYIL